MATLSKGSHNARAAAHAQDLYRMGPSNPNKVYWPATGRTKGELLKYYEQVAPVLLPHLAGRPLVLKRYPDGVGQPFFFMKRAPPHMPTFVGRCAITHRPGEVIDYPVVDCIEALLWVVNLGCIDLNPWPCRCDRVDAPDTMNFDLDPVVGTPFEKLCELAMLIGEQLKRIGLGAWPKLSGGRGIHLFVPIIRGPTPHLVTHFAKELAQALERRHPELVTTEMRRSSRPAGTVLIDYAQNRWGSTLASVYSVRPTPMATVSVPVTWQELERCPRPEEFTMESVPARLSAYGDLFCDPVRGARFDLAPHLEIAASPRVRAILDPEALIRHLGPVPLARRGTLDTIRKGRFHFEVKYDGIRAIAAIGRGKVALRSRNALDLREQYPDAVHALSHLQQACVLDGELTKEGYFVFDLLWLEGADLRDSPYERRSELLRISLRGAEAPVFPAETLPSTLEGALRVVRRRNLEGLVAKREGSPYQGGRTGDWLKLHRERRKDFAVVGYTLLKGHAHAIGALAIASRENGELLYAGKVGSGLSYPEREALEHELRPKRKRERPTDGVFLIHPSEVVEVSFSEWTEEHRLRHPVFQRMRPDKAIGDL